jgi:CO/xanthine dehydrogenase FAD-binding subunit
LPGRINNIDFPVVNCAAAIGGGAAGICLNAIYNKQYRATKAEEAIAGKTIDVANAQAAGTAAVTEARALTLNKWRIQVAAGMVKKAILACA